MQKKLLLKKHEFLPVAVEEIRWSKKCSPAQFVLYDVMCGRQR